MDDLLCHFGAVYDRALGHGPTFSPVPGTYDDPQDVSISTSTAGATIRYTTDGTTPTQTNGTLYTAPVHLAGSLIPQGGGLSGRLDDLARDLRPIRDRAPGDSPAFSPAPGTYADAQDITLSTPTSGASIRYTTDGSAPTDTIGTLYTAPIHITDSLTLKAVAYRAGWRTSSVISGAYTIGFHVAAPTFSPGPGTYTSEQDVTVTTATAGATIRYTTNGSTPTETSGTVYSARCAFPNRRPSRPSPIGPAGPLRRSLQATMRSGLVVVAPELSVAPGLYASAKDVAITTTTGGATIRYTVDGSTPTDAVGILSRARSASQGP